MELYAWLGYTDVSRYGLTHKSTHIGNIVALTLSTRGDFILIGDILKSVSLLRYIPETSKLEMVSCDTDPSWVTAAEFLDDDNFVVADVAFNLMGVRKRSESEVEDERRRLVEVGGWQLGEQVNKFRAGK